MTEIIVYIQVVNARNFPEPRDTFSRSQSHEIMRFSADPLELLTNNWRSPIIKAIAPPKLIHLVFSFRGYRLKTAFHKPSKNVCDLLTLPQIQIIIDSESPSRNRTIGIEVLTSAIIAAVENLESEINEGVFLKVKLGRAVELGSPGSSQRRRTTTTRQEGGAL